MSFGNTKISREDMKVEQENNILEILKEISSEATNKLSPQLLSKVNNIIAGCEAKNYCNFHKVSSADESTTTLLGLMQLTTLLTYEEQAELNDAFILKIEQKIPACIDELEQLKKNIDQCAKSRQDHVREMRERDSKLRTMRDQEKQKLDLIMNFLNHRIQGVTQYGDNCSELLTLKTKILNLKSKILHLQILQNIFTETNQSIKAYNEIHFDLKHSIKETEERIRNFRQIVDDDDLE